MKKVTVTSSEPEVVDIPSTPAAVVAKSCGLSAGKAALIFLVYLVAQFIAGFVLSVGVGIYYGATQQGATPPTEADMPSALFVVMAFVGLVVGGGAAWLFTRLLLRGADRECGWKALGWCFAATRPVIAGIVSGCLIACAYFFLMIKIFPPVPGQEAGALGAAAAAGGWQRALWAVMVLVAAPIEEFVFRGALWSGLRRSFGSPLAASIVVTLAFVVLHASEALSYWPAWLAIAGVGIAAVILRARSGSLIPAIAAHASYNALLVLAVYLVI